MPPSKQMRKCQQKGHKPAVYSDRGSKSYCCPRCLQLLLTPYMTIENIEFAVKRHYPTPDTTLEQSPSSDQAKADKVEKPDELDKAIEAIWDIVKCDSLASSRIGKPTNETIKAIQVIISTEATKQSIKELEALPRIGIYQGAINEFMSNPYVQKLITEVAMQQEAIKDRIKKLKEKS